VNKKSGFYFLKTSKNAELYQKAYLEIRPANLCIVFYLQEIAVEKRKSGQRRGSGATATAALCK